MTGLLNKVLVVMGLFLGAALAGVLISVLILSVLPWELPAAADRIVAYIEFSAGALVTLLSFLLGVVFLARRKFRWAFCFLLLGVLAFLGRSTGFYVSEDFLQEIEDGGSGGSGSGSQRQAEKRE